jgi:prepilin-type N-terminal cleavage/methylation domain-containing protein
MTSPGFRPVLTDQGGFTLVELLVTMIAGLVMLMATLTVLDISVQESAKVADRVEAGQRGRIAMEQLIQELHSSCVAASVAPVLQGSTSTNIQFLSQFGSAAVLTPNLHSVTLSGGSLTDASYAATGGSAPTWTFSSTPSSNRTVLTNVSQATVNSTVQPVFQYYKYVNGTLSSPLSTPLSATDAADTVQVTVNFAVGPLDTSTAADRTIQTTGTAVLRYVPADPTPGAPNLPCQ